MHFWGIISMLTLCAIFFSWAVAEFIVNWLRKEFRQASQDRLDKQIAHISKRQGGLSRDSIDYRVGINPLDHEQTK
jgi:hypothetical protein